MTDARDPPKVVVTRRMPTSLLQDYARSGKIQLVEFAPAAEGAKARGDDDDKAVDDSIPAPRDWLLKNAAGASGVLVMLGDQVNKELIDAAGQQLKVVSTMSVGYDHVDRKVLKEAGVRLGYSELSLGRCEYIQTVHSRLTSHSTAPNVLNAAVADLTLLLTLMITRQVPKAGRIAREGIWKQSPWSPLAFS